MRNGEKRCLGPKRRRRCLKACFTSFTWPVAWKFVFKNQDDNFSGRDELRLEFSVCHCFCSCFLLLPDLKLACFKLRD